MSPKKVILLTGFSSTLARHFVNQYGHLYTIVGVSRTLPDSENVIRGDINTEAQEIVERALRSYGRIDVLINNAVFSSWKEIGRTEAADMAAQFHTNVIAPMELSNAVLRQCWNQFTAAENRSANRSIVHISSIAGVNDYTGYGQGTYAATKAALNTFARHQAFELQSDGIRVNALAPNSFPSIIPTSEVCRSIHELIEGSVSGSVAVLERSAPLDMRSAFPELTEIRNHPQELRQAPFRYVYLTDFFSPGLHRRLCDAFETVRSRGLSDMHSLSRLARFNRYDAWFWLLPPDAGHPLSLFYSTEWKDYFAQLFDLPLTQDVVAEFHHHAIGSNDGSVHNDYNQCCFTEEPLPNGINPWYYRCNYDPALNDMSTGHVKDKMRSIALIYYFNNPDWQPGDGGETALYHKDWDRETAVYIPPVSNSLLAFEVSPESYHGFIRNNRSERNSLIMWFHTETAEKIARHGNVPPVTYAPKT
jgi:NAD(P)-dependent dehydrogenase (short-subunit alcohol dehydrogenase family)